MPERGVLRVYQDPNKRKPSSVARVERAARELGLPLPTTRKEPERAA